MLDVMDLTALYDFLTVQNAFIKAQLNPHPMLVVDLMHEFELGVWKALFIHLLRILNAYDPNSLNHLDSRLAVPSFVFGRAKLMTQL